jgi:hypothetical protein
MAEWLSKRGREMADAAGWTPEQLRAPPRRCDMLDLVGTLAEAVEMLHDRIDEMEKSGVRFRGIYQRAATYKRGDQVTYKTGLWTALQGVPEGTIPGETPAFWQLCVKGVS